LGSRDIVADSLAVGAYEGGESARRVIADVKAVIYQGSPLTVVGRARGQEGALKSHSEGSVIENGAAMGSTTAGTANSLIARERHVDEMYYSTLVILYGASSAG
jgi:hypothetical protein